MEPGTAILAVIAVLLGADLFLKVKTPKGTLKGTVFDPDAPTVPTPKSCPFLPLFQQNSRITGVPVRDMVAIVDYETGGTFNPRTVNPEKDLDERRAKVGRPGADSVGLGQILFPDTAKLYDQEATVEKLFDPSYNLHLAFKVMQEALGRYPKRDRAGFPADAVATYNAGSVKRLTTGEYVNQVYVDRVYSKWLKWEGVS